MNTINTTLKLTTIDRWLAPHAAAMVSYAETDAVFALTLATIIQEEQWNVVEGPTINSSTHLEPTDYTTAEDVLDWLMYELITHPEARASRSLLTSWAREYEAPTDLIWGLALTDTFGPTITGMPKKKSRTAELQIVIDKQWQDDKKSVELSEVTHALSQEVIALELRKAGGKIGSLHPDTAEWCMGGSATKLYQATEETLDALHKTAMDEELHHRIIAEKEKVVAIAISPSVNDALVYEMV